jgi:hypothetical protein
MKANEAFRFFKVRLSGRDAWSGTAIAALFNTLGMLLEIAIIRKIPGISAKPAVISALVGLVLLLVLITRRKSPSVKWASVIQLINNASVITVLLLTNPQFALLEKNWVPFQANKLGCLFAAIVAPTFWIGLLNILGFCLSGLLQFEFFFPPNVDALAIVEPWPLLAFGLAGVLTLIYRFRRAQLEQELARIEAQHFAIRRLTDAFMNIRDHMNSPLQVIELSVELLRDSKESAEPIINRIDRSVQNLREINSLLVQHEKQIDGQSWRVGRD